MQIVFLIANILKLKSENSPWLSRLQTAEVTKSGVYSPRPFVLHSHKYTNTKDDWFIIFHFTKTDEVSILCNNLAFELTMYCFCFLSVCTSHNKIRAHCLSGGAAVLEGEGAGIWARAPSLPKPPAIWASPPQALSSPAPPSSGPLIPCLAPTPSPGPPPFPLPKDPFPFSPWAPFPGPSPKFRPLPRPPSPGSLP